MGFRGCRALGFLLRQKAPIAAVFLVFPRGEYSQDLIFAIGGRLFLGRMDGDSELP